MTIEQSLLVIWPQVVALIALTVIAFAGAYIAFMRQEVRA
jgi:ABC-2 type transport system permease protein